MMENLLRYGVRDRVAIHVGYSTEIVPLFPPGSFDLVFIDGLHDRRSVETDLGVCRRVARSGGRIAFHDYGRDGVKTRGAWVAVRRHRGGRRVRGRARLRGRVDRHPRGGADPVTRAVALVPARAGSQRVPGKNVLPLAGHPLIAYSIAAARESGVFDAVVCSTDSEEIAAVARRYGAEVPGLRPAEIAGATSPDVEWVQHVMAGRDEELFSILRPTSPFRTGATIRRAYERLLEVDADSIRAVELVKQHPGKMWVLDGDLMRPFAERPGPGTPWHSMQYASLPQVYVQNSSLEIAWTRVLAEDGSIAGRRVAPFLTEGWEGFSIDYPEDVERAERAVAAGEAELPQVEVPA